MNDSENGSAPGERWKHLVNAAFRLEERSTSAENPNDEVLILIDSALEVFASELDPISDFEGYAVRRLLLALRQAVCRR
jgi:hypothetical protein